jgi:hypothetical protein
LNWHFLVVPFQPFELALPTRSTPGLRSNRVGTREPDPVLPIRSCRQLSVTAGSDPTHIRHHCAATMHPRCGAVSRYASLEGVSRTLFTACAFLGHQQLDRQSGTDSSFGFGIHAPTLDQPWESQDSFQPRDRLHRRRISKTRFVALRTPALPLQEQGGANRDVS